MRFPCWQAHRSLKTGSLCLVLSSSAPKVQGVRVAKECGFAFGRWIKEKRHFRSRKANIDATGLLRLCGASLISVVQSPDLWNRYHASLFWWFHCPGLRGVFAQG